MRLISLAEMEPGETGIVKTIRGGFGMAARLQSLGLFPGQKVRKVSSVFNKGPVVIEVNRSQVALGFGRANKIYIEMYKNIRNK